MVHHVKLLRLKRALKAKLLKLEEGQQDLTNMSKELMLQEGILKAGNECGWGRVQAGFHYPSDYHIGNLLGEKMFILMNREDYGNS